MLKPKSSQLSFYGDHIYDRIIPEGHFLKWFVGLAIDESSPDATSLTRFRERLGEERFACIFNQIVSLARERGLISDRLSIVDSTHVKAKVDTFKMQTKPEHTPDKDAHYGYKTKNNPF